MKILIKLTERWLSSGGMGNIEFYNKYKNKILLVEYHYNEDVIFTGQALIDCKHICRSSGTHSEGIWYVKLDPSDIVKHRIGNE
jgi:hypothetical protein